MNLPTVVFSHCVAHGPKVTPKNLAKNLWDDQGLGYGGMVIVPVLINPAHKPKAIVKQFRLAGMRGLVCGLLPGNGPSPFEQPEAALKSLKWQASFAAALAEADLGPAVMIGPMHTHHTKPFPTDRPAALKAWLIQVEELLRGLGLRALFEPLNDTEDKTPEPFQTLEKELVDMSAGFHFDTGHAHARGLNLTDFRRLAPKIGYFELANVGRWPLGKPMGINFEAYAQAMADLPDDCLVGVEPFALKLIKVFRLEKLCDTNVRGEEALRRDAKYLQELGIMAGPAFV